MLAQTGGFDEDFFLYREETDLCKRAHDGGWKIVYDPAVYVYHHHKASSQALSDKGLAHRLNSHYLYLSKHHGWPVRAIAYSLFLVFSIIMSCVMLIGRIAGNREAGSRLTYYARVLGWHLRNPVKCMSRPHS
jgi:GT2 family glycosyltransferase